MRSARRPCSTSWSRFLSVLLATATVYLVYRCARLLGDRPTAVLSSLIAATIPPFALPLQRPSTSRSPTSFGSCSQSFFLLRALDRHRLRDYLGLACRCHPGDLHQGPGLRLLCSSTSPSVAGSRSPAAPRPGHLRLSLEELVGSPSGPQRPVGCCSLCTRPKPPLQIRGLPPSSLVDHPSLTESVQGLRADLSWVWSRSFCQSLRPPGLRRWVCR